jgi:phage-related minor tail protein
MDEELDRLVVRIRADTSGLTREIEDIRETLGGTLGRSADAAGRGIEGALLRAVRTGKLGFEDLKKVALSVLGEIATGAIRGGLDALFGGGRGGLAGVIGGLLGSPGRATGGPVSPGRAYIVGERGPEVFVPTSSGRIDTSGPRGGGRDVRIAITINSAGAGGGDAPQALARSSRQVARAVRAAIEGAEA